MFNFWWLAKWSEQRTSTKIQKRPPKSSKNEIFLLDYIQLLMIGWEIQMMSWLKCKKGPLSHWKMKCLFWIMFNFWWLAERSEWRKLTKMQKMPLSHWKIKCSFLDYIQLWWLVKQSEQWKLTKMQKRPPKSSKN